MLSPNFLGHRLLPTSWAFKVYTIRLTSPIKKKKKKERKSQGISLSFRSIHCWVLWPHWLLLKHYTTAWDQVFFPVRFVGLRRLNTSARKTINTYFSFSSRQLKQHSGAFSFLTTNSLTQVPKKLKHSQSNINPLKCGSSCLAELVISTCCGCVITFLNLLLRYLGFCQSLKAQMLFFYDLSHLPLSEHARCASVCPVNSSLGLLFHGETAPPAPSHKSAHLKLSLFFTSVPTVFSSDL